MDFILEIGGTKLNFLDLTLQLVFTARIVTVSFPKTFTPTSPSRRTPPTRLPTKWVWLTMHGIHHLLHLPLSAEECNYFKKCPLQYLVDDAFHISRLKGLKYFFLKVLNGHWSFFIGVDLGFFHEDEKISCDTKVGIFFIFHSFIDSRNTIISN